MAILYPLGGRGTLTVRLTRGGRALLGDSATAADGEALLHLRSIPRLRGAYVLRITEDPRRGRTRRHSVRVAI